MVGICPNCKKTYGEGIKYCLECGTPLHELDTLEPEMRGELVVLQATNQAAVEQRSEDIKPNPKEAPQVDVETKLPGQPVAKTIRPILEELIKSIRSLEASLKIVTDTNMLLLKKIYELESMLDASEPR